MSQYPLYGRAPGVPLDDQQRTDAGALARFFNAVYAWMAAGLGLTALVAMWVSSRPDVLRYVFSTGIWVVLLVAQLALVWTVSAAVRRISATTATVLFLLYAALNGLTLSVIFLAYAHAAIASAFIVTAGMFAAMSLYGFVTKRDLTSMGAFLFMGLIGIILASVVSLFWHNTMLTVLINYIGVFIFLGLTAYDTQKLKEMALATQGNAALAARLSISGALALYLDFLNLFLFLLRILGDRNR
jgi:FtsH-binding integral membrane protein